MTPTTIALLATVLLFALHVIVQVRPSLSRRAREADGKVRAARARAREGEARDRALALAEAGEAAAGAGRWISAAGSFLRAMRVDPSSGEVVDRAAAALARRPRLLESLLLRRVAAAPAGGGTDRDEALVACLRGLESIYRARKDKGRARLVERLRAREDSLPPGSL